MIYYTIEETGSKIIYKLPEKQTIKNLLSRVKFVNNTKENNIKIENGKDYRIISNIALETITVDDTNPVSRLVDSKDITLGFKLTDDEQVTLTLPEDITELESSVKTICDPRFINGYEYFYDFIQSVLFDLVYNDKKYIELVEANLITPTLDLKTSDTESLTNASVTVTVTDPEETPIKDIVLTGSISDGTTTTDIEETSDSNGEISLSIESAGEYVLKLASTEDENYSSVSLEETIVVEDIAQPPSQDPQDPQDPQTP